MSRVTGSLNLEAWQEACSLDLYLQFQAFGSAWAYGMVDQIELVGKEAVTSYLIANFGAVFLGCALWFGLNDNQVWGGFVGALLFYSIGCGISHFYLTKTLAGDTEGKWTIGKLWWELSLGNILALRNRIQPVIGPIPFIWCFLMKHIIPHILIILFVNLAQSDNGAGEPIFGGYGSYPTGPYQVLGILTFVFALFLFINGLIFPTLYEPLAKPQVHDDDIGKNIEPEKEEGSKEEEEEVNPAKIEEEQEA